MTIARQASRVAALAVLTLSLTSHLSAQDFSQAQPAGFLRSNDKFSTSLLNTIHEATPDRNIVIAPLPVSLTFAAFVDRSVDSKAVDEIISAFQWEGTHDLNAAGHMLHARFEKPRPRPTRHAAQSKASKDDSYYLRSFSPRNCGFQRLSSTAARAPYLRWDEKAGLRRDAIRSQGLTRSRRNAKETGL
jgi:hypothetical protein